MNEVFAKPSPTLGAKAADNNAMLIVSNVEKTFGARDALTKALDGVSFCVEEGEFVAVMGPSGSGKTTLLNCISTIDQVTSGLIMLGERNVTSLRSRQLAKFRRDELGFIFQDSNLLDTLNGFENIALALTIKGVSPREIDARVRGIAHTLNIEDVLKKFPRQMSGGQRQRVAAARAIVCNPKLVLADEPTGALDSRNATTMLETLSLLNERMHATIMMVTHDAYAASFASRVLFMKDGKLFNELRRGETDRSLFYGRILEVVSLLGGESIHAA